MKKAILILILLLSLGIYAKDETEKKGYIIYENEKFKGVIATDSSLPIGYDSATKIRVDELPINNTNTYRPGYFQIIIKDKITGESNIHDIGIDDVEIYNKKGLPIPSYESLYYETVYETVLNDSTQQYEYETTINEIRKKSYKKIKGGI